MAVFYFWRQLKAAVPRARSAWLLGADAEFKLSSIGFNYLYLRSMFYIIDTSRQLMAYAVYEDSRHGSSS